MHDLSTLAFPPTFLANGSLITKKIKGQSALLLFSGGQDSATCLAWALSIFQHVETIGFSYGQTHEIEMDCRQKIRNKISSLKPEWKERLKQDHILTLNALAEISDTALTRQKEISMSKEGLPNTFVPGRNILFITYAAALAWRRNIHHLITGVCETDFSGYPDCRDDTMKALQVTLNLGMDRHFNLHTPLMWLTKSQSWHLCRFLGGDALIDIIRRESHTCYHGTRDHEHEWGFGCGQCPACELRAKGWKEYKDSL